MYLIKIKSKNVIKDSNKSTQINIYYIYIENDVNWMQKTKQLKTNNHIEWKNHKTMEINNKIK